ncbi:MAG TPA: 2OG-Fe(II) oxygenase [Blastocatellia bacterium]|nr:2OG-Fe(II) oxygenase [Blastocatellia bacterium]
MTKSHLSDHFDLYLVRNFFDADFCRELIAEMHSSTTSPAVTYGQGSCGEVNETVRKVARVQPSEKTITRVTQRLMDHRERVAEHFGVSLRSCEEPQFLCYRTGDFFVAHQDGNTGLVTLETDKSRRVSVSIFLNSQNEEPDGDSYGGGSLVFSDWRSNKRFELAGEPGTLVAFRSEITHEVVPVTHGERYSIVSWFG